MRIFKKYHEKHKIIKTTFAKQKKDLSKSSKHLEQIRDTLNRGECVHTSRATYSIKKEALEK